MNKKLNIYLVMAAMIFLITNADLNAQSRAEDMRATENYSPKNINTTSDSPATFEIQKLAPLDGGNTANFGYSAATSGNTLIIGSPYATATTGSQGTAHIYIHNGSSWVLQQKIVASDPGLSDSFGWSVAISGDTVIVGAFYDEIGASGRLGSAYVFVRNGTTWTEQQKLTASDGGNNYRFGFSVGVDNNTAVIGSSFGDVGSNIRQGSAYVFVRNGAVWTEQQKLTSNDGAGDDTFGFSVAVSGETVIVGANHDRVGNNISQGSAYVFSRNGTIWTQQQQLLGSNRSSVFGNSVIIVNDTIVVGAPYESEVGFPYGRGAVYIFARSGAMWTQQQRITSGEPTARIFGGSVAMSGGTLAVGADGTKINENFEQGTVYIFSKSGANWVFRERLVSSDGEGGDLFGKSVAISSGTIIAGANKNHVGQFSSQGAAYIFADNSTAPSKKFFDFDGDGKSDISVFRPSNGAWYLQQSTSGFTGVAFGQNGDLITPADFDGDGKTDVAVFRPSNGAWYRLNSSNGSFSGVIFGQNGDIPIPGDFDDDGKADISVFRPSNGAWYRLNSSDGSFSGLIFGQNGDKPLLADFDGDGKNDIAVFRPSDGAFYWLESSTGQFKGIQFGISTDIPTMGDFDGDGKTDIAVFRPSNGAWYRYNSSNGTFAGVGFGQSGDIPVTGDYDGDGKADIAVFRPSNGAWYYLNSSNGGFVGVSFGFGNDKPIPAAFH